MKMITTILIEDEITEDDLIWQSQLRAKRLQDYPDWEDDGSLERNEIINIMLATGLADEDSKVMVEIRYED